MNKIKIWSRVTPRTKPGVYLSSALNSGKIVGLFKGTGVVLEVVSIPLTLDDKTISYQVCLVTNNEITGWVGFGALDVVELEQVD